MSAGGSLPELYDLAHHFCTVSGVDLVVAIGHGELPRVGQLGAERRLSLIHCTGTSAPTAAAEPMPRTQPIDLDAADCVAAAGLTGPRTLVLCDLPLEAHADLAPLCALLAACLERGATVLLGMTPVSPPDPKAMARHVARLAALGLRTVLGGLTPGTGGPAPAAGIVTLHDRRLAEAIDRIAGTSVQRPLAIVAAYNEADVIAEVVADLLDQGCDVALIDNWSTDRTLEAVEPLRQQHPAHVTTEVFPAEGPQRHYEWQAILRRKEEIARRHPGRWIIHTDADELRRAPFRGLTLAQGLAVAGMCGANRVGFNQLFFRPTAADGPAAMPVEDRMRHYEYGDKSGQFRKFQAWLQGAERIDLSSRGGHWATFDGVVDLPWRFLIKHYPMRSAAHGRRKVLAERQARWSPREREQLGWHKHYDGFDERASFEWSRSALQEWQEERFWSEDILLVISDLAERRWRRNRA